MPLCHFSTADNVSPRLGWTDTGGVYDLAAWEGAGLRSIDDLLTRTVAEIRTVLASVPFDQLPVTPHTQVTLHKPIGGQEVWCCGVTYLRSRDARMEESSEQSVYDRVYNAARPEIFFKGMANRVVGPGEAVAIRGDSDWNVPEPELALVVNTHGEIVGYTVGNDMSSRSIEGENPLYLPQAKVYSAACALGPAIVLTDEIADAHNLAIRMTIARDGAAVVAGESNANQLARPMEELVQYLWRANDFPAGAFVLTGTGIVPPSEFTLHAGDVVEISIESIGMLGNTVRAIPT